MASCIAQADIFATVASDEKYNGALPAERWKEIAVEMGLEVLSNNRVANILCYVLSCASRPHMVVCRTLEIPICSRSNGRCKPTFMEIQGQSSHRLA